MDQSSGSALTFHRTAVDDAATLASLVLAFSRQEFDWLLGVPPAAREAFLRRTIAAPSGCFSQKHHLVATTGGQPIAAPATQDG